MAYKKDSKGRHLKIATIVWTIDPENNPRFLLRHSKPFGGYDDEWTICFGNVEADEKVAEAAFREASEEFGIKGKHSIQDLDYEVEYEDKKRGLSVIKFYSVKVDSLDVPISLNEESIGYDWMKIEKVNEVMKYDDEKKAFNILMKLNKLS